MTAGLVLLCKYSLASGPPAAAPTRWPVDLGLLRIPGRATLVMVVHPMCPCSGASLNELAVLQANCGDRLWIDIVFAEPQGLRERPESTQLWHWAVQIPGATLIADKDGIVSRGLGATTSGQVFFYDASGALRFNGGITDSRGHAGNNTGRTAIEAIVRNQATATVRTPVFGCAL